MGMKDLIQKVKNWLNEPWADGQWGHHWHDGIIHVTVDGCTYTWPDEGELEPGASAPKEKLEGPCLIKVLTRLGRFGLEQALPPLLRNIEWKEAHPAFYCRISAQEGEFPAIPVWEIGGFVNPGQINPMTNVMSTLGACGPVVINDYNQDWAQPAINAALDKLRQQYDALIAEEAAAVVKAEEDRLLTIEAYKQLLDAQLLESKPEFGCENADN